MYVRTCTPALGIHVLLHNWCRVTEPACVHVCMYMQPAQCVYCVECGIRSHVCMKGEGVLSGRWGCMTVRMVQHVKLGTAANTCKVWIRSWSRNLPCSPSFLPICLSLCLQLPLGAKPLSTNHLTHPLLLHKSLVSVLHMYVVREGSASTSGQVCIAAQT